MAMAGAIAIPADFPVETAAKFAKLPLARMMPKATIAASASTFSDVRTIATIELPFTVTTLTQVRTTMVTPAMAGVLQDVLKRAFTWSASVIETAAAAKGFRRSR